MAISRERTQNKKYLHRRGFWTRLTPKDVPSYFLFYSAVQFFYLLRIPIKADSKLNEKLKNIGVYKYPFKKIKYVVTREF